MRLYMHQALLQLIRKRFLSHGLEQSIHMMAGNMKLLHQLTAMSCIQETALRLPDMNTERLTRFRTLLQMQGNTQHML